ncbi:hypothetical protein NPIL_161771 [Nephila pilipes]|uniref:Uncharacterized protein n=1 Tax=Nephila pilipes TaxID=299642 RepID=A0A8X6TBF2_NEPPI|nr:hypothetical protein NPIL_161771 [Nephila pilipes]
MGLSGWEQERDLNTLTAESLFWVIQGNSLDGGHIDGCEEATPPKRAWIMAGFLAALGGGLEYYDEGNFNETAVPPMRLF